MNRAEALLARLGSRRAAAMQFLRFCGVGLAGFFVDTGVVYATKAEIGLYWGGVVAFIAAASFTWLGNRLWTFRGQGGGSAARQWVRFVLSNTGGFILNRGTYFTLVTISPTCAAHPELAIFAGLVVGVFLNFTLSRKLVFR